MKVIARFTWRCMCQSRGRTLVTVAGAVISAAMLTAVMILGSSFVNLMRLQAIRNQGSWQASFWQVCGEDADRIIRNPEVEASAEGRQEGFAKIEEMEKAGRRPYMSIQSLSSFDLLPVTLEEGRFPRTETELALDQGLWERLGEGWQIGDQVTLDVGKRFRTDESGQKKEVADFSYYDNEILVPESRRTYTIVGIVDSREFSGGFWLGYQGLGELEGDKGYQVYVTYKRADKNLYALSENLAGEVRSFRDEELIQGASVQYNGELLFYMGLSSDSYLMRTLYQAIGVVSLIILTASVALIHNAFGISLAERSRMLGMFSSVGATRRQKRASVFIEAAIIGCISIPLGILCGVLGIWATFQVIGDALKEIFGVPYVELSVDVRGILCVAALSAVPLYLSAWFPARRASRISPIDAIRQNQDLVFSPGKARGKGIVGGLLGFEADMGLRNLKRNRHRYLVTIFSIAVSVTLFLSCSAFAFYMKKSFEMSQDMFPYDYQIMWTQNADADSGLEAELLQADHGKTSLGVTNYMSIGAFLDRDQLTADYLEEEEWQEGMPVYVNVNVLDEASFLQYASRVGAAAKEHPLILANQVVRKKDNIFREVRLTSLKDGDEVRFSMVGRSGEMGEVLAKVDCVTDLAAPFMLNYQYLLYPIQFVTDEEGFGRLTEAAGLEGKMAGAVSVEYTSDDPRALESETTEICREHPEADWSIYSTWEERQRANNYMTVVSVFLYGFTVLISLVSLANIINTISTGMALRRREFAMFLSYGMTVRGLWKMVWAEGIFYGLRALLWSLPVSLGIMYGIYRILNRNYSFAFVLPWGSIAAAALGVFAIVAAAIGWSGRNLGRMQVADTLRDEL